MEYDVFISYSRKDSAIANQIYEALSKAGISCFIDLEGISGGASFPAVLSEAILGSKLLLLVASENSYASEFTRKEITFAVSNKGSHFIFPLIIDGSHLPTDLEFLLSNINWRTLGGKYHIETDLVKDVQAKLADPHAGETLKQREKSTVKTMIAIIFIVLGLVAAGVGYYLWDDYSRRQAAELERQAANQARACSENLVLEARSFLSRADSLRDTHNIFETFGAEVHQLNRADSCLRASRAIIQQYQGTTYQDVFRDASMEGNSARSALQTKRDSMYRTWAPPARDLFQEFKSNPDKINREVALIYVNMILQLYPQNQEMQQYHAQLAQ